jgi:flagellar basal-body rod protein FlgB
MLDPLAARLEHCLVVSARQTLVTSASPTPAPGYKTKDVDFQMEFLSQIEGAAPRAVEVTGLRTKNDGNNVSLDREARLLAENALRFNVASSLLRSEIRAIKSAIRGES